MADVRSPIPMRGLSWELMCVLLRMHVMCSEIAGNVSYRITVLQYQLIKVRLRYIIKSHGHPWTAMELARIHKFQLPCCKLVLLG